MQPRTVYFIQSYTPSGIEQTNRDLKFTGAHHLVMSYDWLLSQDLRFKAEIYYQYLYDAPVRESPNSTFSMLNEGANFYIPTEDSLVNKGKGKNYGLELTLEKFLSHNFYYMLNTSFYQSKYTGYDGVWRNTAFNGNYIFNAMAGYEFWVSTNRAIGFDLKSTWAGGKRYIPVNEVASTPNNIVYDYTQAFNWKYKDYFRTDFKIYYRQNSKKVYFEEAVDLQNVFNTKNIYYQDYVPQTKKYNTYYQSALFPMITFRCLF
jgi:hypothetical protein